MVLEQLTVPALVHRWASAQPGKPFLVTEDRSLTYGELDTVTAHLARRLAAAGVGKGTRVGILMPNGPGWATVACAASRAGAVLVPLSTLLRPPELAAHLRSAGVEHLVLVPTFRGRDYLADLASLDGRLRPGASPLHVEPVPRLRAITVWDDGAAAGGAGEVPADVAEALEASVRPADDLAIVFTSGSQGAPKAVVHTHGGALRATAAGLEARCLGREDRLYIPMPFFWVGGFGTGLLSVLVAGATLVTEAEPEPERTLRLLERERVTLFRGWPDQAAALAAHPGFDRADLGSLRPGSLDAVLPAELRGRPGSRANLFGMTEAFGPYCGDRLDRDLPPGKEGSCGRPFAGVEVRIADVDTGSPVPPGTVGEIQLRGPNLLRGICGRARAEVFTVDGFYPTGDLGVLDADGYLTFHGRRDDMFKVKGATVYPSEVERALLSVPGVRRALVVDVTDGGSQQVAAAVVPAAGHQWTAERLREEARGRLSAFKVPTRWVVLDDAEVPMLATGKVDKAGLRRLLAASPGARPRG